MRATGWTNESNLNIQASSVLAGVEGASAVGATGNRFLRLVSDNPDPQNTGFLVQNLGTMVAGETYVFQGDVLGGGGNQQWGANVELASDGALAPATVYASDVLSGFAPGSVGIGALNISYMATGADNGKPLFLWLRAQPASSGDATRGGLDNIELEITDTPEPGTLFSTGFVVMVLLRRRKG